MAAETEREGPMFQNDGLLDKIEMLYREADELSASLKPSSSVKSQDVTRLPIIGSLPVITAEKKNAPPSQKNNLQPFSPIEEANMMTTIVLTGIVSRPGSEHGHDDTTSLADKHLEKTFSSSSSEDPFIAIKNAVEIAGRSDSKTDYNLASEPAKGPIRSRNSDLANALAEIIKEQVDSALETRIAAIQEAWKTQASGNSDKAGALNKNLAPKREAAEPALKKVAKTTQQTKNREITSKLAKKTKSIIRTNAKNTQISKKPVRKNTKKATSTRYD